MYYPTILIRIPSATDPTPHHIRHPKKPHPCNIRSAPHPTKNMDADVVKILSDLIRSAFTPSCQWSWKYSCGKPVRICCKLGWRWKGKNGKSTCSVLSAVRRNQEITFFFSCVLAIWTSFKEALGWDRAPCSLQDFFDNWSPLGCVNYNLKLFLLGLSYGFYGLLGTN
jgi:hypothetical protein